MPEVQDIFKAVNKKYKGKYRLPANQLKAINSIVSCRTVKLGGHKDVCTECGCYEISYNSCRNRHCPKCQGSARQKWIDGQYDNIVNVPYFHIVFTIPAELNPIVLRNQKELYSILFKAASESLIKLTKDKKYLGAQIGLTAVLHTWGQNLMDHPHLHCIVPGGGLSKDGLHFVRSKKKFFLPVKALSKVFRGKFLNYLKEAHSQGIIKYMGEIVEYGFSDNFFNLLSSLYEKKWVVYCKKPFKEPGHVINYLGRYTHRVAISNQRITGFNGENVSFLWKDYRTNDQKKEMTITAEEFIRRFLMHVLPDKFMKIRHYGFLSNRNRKTKLLKCKKLTGAKFTSKAKEPKKEKQCSECGSFYINRISFFPKKE